MMKVLCDRKRIDVKEIYSIPVSWGNDYKLYKDRNGIFYVTLCDGSDEVFVFSNLENKDEKEQIETFKTYIKNMEDEMA